MDAETIKLIQNSIGYEFKNPRLLEQAFVRKSYSEENPGIISNEVLEFYGDSALSMFVTVSLCQKFSKITEDNQFYSEQNEAALSEIKAYNVNTNILSHCIRLLGFEKYLLLNKSDKKNDVYISRHVQEDLFEAIIGAVAVDSNWHFERIFYTCKAMLKLADFDKNYLIWVINWCNKNGYSIPTFQVDLGGARIKNIPKQFPLYNYQFSLYDDQEKKENKNWASFKVNKVVLFQKELGISVDSDSDTLYSALMDCAKQVYCKIQTQEMRKAVGNPDFDNSVNQLNMLAQKEFIAVPKYEYLEKHDENGNPIWYCECEVNEIYVEDSSVKKEAKKKAAYKALCNLLNYDPEADEDYYEDDIDDLDDDF